MKVGQELPDSNLTQLATITVDGQAGGVPMTPPPDIYSSSPKKLRELHQNILANLDAVKASKTADKFAQALAASVWEIQLSRWTRPGHSASLLILNSYQPTPEGQTIQSCGGGLRTTQTSPEAVHCDASTVHSLFSM